MADPDWKILDKKTEEAHTLLVDMFGDKIYHRTIESGLVIPTLEELKKINLEKLPILPDPYDDWTTYTEVDTGGYLTVAANHITVTGMARGCDSKVHKDHGVAHFGMLFTHDIDCVEDSATQSWSVMIIHWMLVNTVPAVPPETDPFIKLFSYQTGVGQHVYYIDIDDGATEENDSTGNLADGTMRYNTIDRNAVDLNVKLYTNVIRTILWFTITVNKGSTSFRHMVNAATGDGSGGNITGDVYNLDLNEGGAVVGGSGGGVITNMASKMLGL